MGCVDVAFVQRELIEVAEIDSLRGHRKKVGAAENDEPMRKRGNVNHPLWEHGHILGLPIEIGMVGSASIANCSRFGVETYDRSEMGQILDHRMCRRCSRVARVIRTSRRMIANDEHLPMPMEGWKWSCKGRKWARPADSCARRASWHRWACPVRSLGILYPWVTCSSSASAAKLTEGRHMTCCLPSVPPSTPLHWSVQRTRWLLAHYSWTHLLVASSPRTHPHLRPRCASP